MKFRIVSQKDEDRNPDIPPAKLGEVTDVKGHLYFYDGIQVRGIFPLAEPCLILIDDDFWLESCIDIGCTHVRRKTEQKGEADLGIPRGGGGGIVRLVKKRIEL